MAGKNVQFEEKDDIGIITLNDGKANAFNQDLVQGVDACLDRTEDAGAIIITGSNGRLSGGFDLAVMRGDDPKAAGELGAAGADLMMRLFLHPRPVVIACNGHAVALGGFLILTADLRIGCTGDYKVGLPEVAIGMGMPKWGMELARARLSKRYLQRAVVLAELFNPATAAEIGYLDELVAPDSLMDRAMEEAVRLKELPNPFFKIAKVAERQSIIDTIRSDV